MAGGTGALEIAFISVTGIGLIINIAAIFTKLFKDFTNPKLWKYSLIFQDVAHLFLCIGLLLYYFWWKFAFDGLCDASSFFILFGISEIILAILTTVVILLSIQNPGKASHLSKFHRKLILLIVIPVILAGTILSGIPFIVFTDQLYVFTIDCLPLRRRLESATAYGSFVISIWWVTFLIASVCYVISILKVWKFNNRINSAQNNVWQTLLVTQGKSVLKFLAVEHVLWLAELLLVTVVLYTDNDSSHNRYAWLVMTSLAVTTVLHGLLSNVGNSMWGTCCCRSAGAVEEPQRKLKKLELLRIEAPGKLRMKATWNIGKGASRRGLMKVYGVNHLKAWAQEIVMLGMLRRAQHPSLIQCLWTSSSNPYYETMTLISGEIITSDSRIICLEMTNGGTLQEFLQKVELPLPEPCQRMIIHDVAEGLFYLHHQNILHSNLSSSCIYLKGSLQPPRGMRERSMVLRAAVGDFEDAQMYGTLQQSTDSSITDKRHFFLPDIRSFALIALEIVSKMCEKKFQNRYVNYDTEHLPLKLNMANVISDDEDDYQEPYGYEVEDTYRMFESVNPGPDDGSGGRKQGRGKGKHKDLGIRAAHRTDSLDNLMDKERPTSPRYTGLAPLPGINMGYKDSESEDDEVARYSVPYRSKDEERAMSPTPKVKSPVHAQLARTPDRCKSPIEERGKQRKGGQGTQSSKDSRIRLVSPKRVVSPLAIPKSEPDRGASPDPMQDAKLQELRSKAEIKHTKKDRRSSSRKQKKEDTQTNGQAFEAFVGAQDDSKNSSKRKDGSWLSKPTSILKSFTGSDTAVSVFKAKPIEEDNYLDAIEEEEIEVPAGFQRKGKSTSKTKSDGEIWNIIDEQYYHQVNKKVAGKLRKTVSGESRSSLWSFISTPEDMDDDDQLGDIIECLPGMAEPDNLRKSHFTVSEIMAEREKSLKEKDSRITYVGSSNSKFELIDYYELLVQKKITMNDVPLDKREMLQNVVELKLEEKMKREGMKTDSRPSTSQYTSDNVLRSDEMYDNAMHPGGNYLTPNGKIKVVSFRRQQQVTQVASGTNPGNDQHPVSPNQDPRIERARSAPLKRPRTPMHKTQEPRTEINPAFTESKAYVKRTRARSALKRALNKNGAHGVRYERDRSSADKPNLALKYATVKKLNPVHESSSSGTDSINQDEGTVLRVPVPTSESFSVHVKPAPPLKSTDIRRYSSFSSDESSSSLASSIRMRKADVSLTSGELTSLSSQAESDHFETDGHATDIEGPAPRRQMHTTKRKLRASSKVDSGFDSGSMSSEMSDAFGHSKQYYTPLHHHSKSESWATNYAKVGYIPNSPSNFSNKFMPPVDCLPEEQYPVDSMRGGGGGGGSRPSSAIANRINGSAELSYAREEIRDDDSGIHAPYEQCDPCVEDRGPTPKVIAVSSAAYGGTLNLSQRAMSPTRPMSPERALSPNRAFSPTGCIRDDLSVSPAYAEDAGQKHAVSPTPKIKVDFAEPKHTLSHEKDLSPNRAFSPTGLPPDDWPMSSSYAEDAGQKHSVSPNPKLKVDFAESKPTLAVTQQQQKQVASKRYRELVKKGVPLRASRIDSSPNRESPNPPRNCPDEADSDIRPGTADSVDAPIDDQQLFSALDSKGFFRNASPNPSSAGVNSTRSKTPVQNSQLSEKQRRGKRKKTKQLPLDQLVSDTSQQGDGASDTSGTQGRQRKDPNHLSVVEDVLLNQPTSEDSETCSIQTTKSSTSSPSGNKSKVVVDAELVIDRIFSQHNQGDASQLDVEVEAALGLDQDPFKAVNQMYSQAATNEYPNLNTVPLLKGMCQKHVNGCVDLASHLHVVTVRDLLPAKKDTFDILRNKLQQVGQLGSVGNQLLDIIQKCWLLEVPPASGDLVEELTDPVAETEV